MCRGDGHRDTGCGAAALGRHVGTRPPASRWPAVDRLWPVRSGLGEFGGTSPQAAHPRQALRRAGSAGQPRRSRSSRRRRLARAAVAEEGHHPRPGMGAGGRGTAALMGPAIRGGRPGPGTTATTSSIRCSGRWRAAPGGVAAAGARRGHRLHRHASPAGRARRCPPSRARPGARMGRMGAANRTAGRCPAMARCGHSRARTAEAGEDQGLWRSVPGEGAPRGSFAIRSPSACTWASSKGGAGQSKASAQKALRILERGLRSLL